ncbi:ABC transporter substrate-binding protein [Deinococcus lacus]|uniref:ABC transporter substrate-binding protein n=1 Tax=Deinococcus lacus TaxID=392561 RepID=A0ABW1YDU3_9DEIO
MKRTAALLSLTLLLASCANTAEKTTATTATAGADTPAASAATAQPAASGSQRKLEFWHSMGGEKEEWIKKQAEAYNAEHPEVEIVPVNKGSYNDSLQATILAARQGTPPALVQIFEVGSQMALDSGAFQPIGDIGDVDFSDYIEPVINYYTIGGKINSLPFNSSSPVLYYNKTLMGKAGLDATKPPQTFGEVLSACEKIEAAKLGANCYGMSLNGWFFEQWMAQQGATLLNSGNGREARATEINLSSPEARKIFDFFKTLNDKGWYTYTGKLEDWDGSDANFSEQKVVFHVTSTADIGKLKTASEGSGFEMGVGKLIIPDGTERSGVVIGGASLWIPKDIDKDTATEALNFATFLTGSERMAEWHKLTGYYPVRKSSIDLLKKEGWFDKAPLQTVAFEQLTETKPSPATAGGLNGAALETRKIVEEGVQKILNGSDVDSAVQETQQRANDALKQYNANFE